MVGILSRSDVIRPFRVSNLKVEDQREIDNNINKFIDNFDKKFVAVSKFRTRWWLVASLLSAVIGFIVAWALILRIIID